VFVGFPLTRTGLYPSTCTVAALQRICGSQSTVKWVPILHSYDVNSLADVGLLRLGKPDVSSSSGSVHGSLNVGGGDGHHTDRTLEWSLRCESFILHYLCRSPAQRRWVMEKLLWSRDFQRALPPALTATDDRVMEDTWYTYAMGVLCQDTPSLPSTVAEVARAEEGTTGDNLEEGADDSAALLRAFTASAPCEGAAHAERVRLHSLRQPLPSLPHRRFLAFTHHHKAAWGEKLRVLAATPESSGAAVLLDCSDKAVMASLELVKTQFVATAAQRARLPYLNFVLIGEDVAARPVLQLLPCAAVVSSASAFRDIAHASLQQVRLYASPQWPMDLQQDTLVAALSYLQRKETPHIVAAGFAPQRLLLALCREALTMAQSMPDASRIETAAREHLGMRLGPFALMDAYGAATLASMAVEVNEREEGRRRATTPSAGVSTAMAFNNTLLASCARAMAREGLLGVRSVRGGFYGPAAVAEGSGGGAAPVLREAVLNTYVRHHATSAEIAARLRAAVLNVACELIIRGEVHSTDDIDALSLSTLGWRGETGGVLYQVDELGAEGLPQLVQLMTSLSSSGAAPHLAPHPLLSKMVAQQLRFANLKNSGLLPS
jgi:hypothetical protein